MYMYMYTSTCKNRKREHSLFPLNISLSFISFPPTWSPYFCLPCRVPCAPCYTYQTCELCLCCSKLYCPLESWMMMSQAAPATAQDLMYMYNVLHRMKDWACGRAYMYTHVTDMCIHCMHGIVQHTSSTTVHWQHVAWHDRAQNCAARHKVASYPCPSPKGRGLGMRLDTRVLYS